MLAADKISKAFKAIVEETEKLIKKESNGKNKKRLATILSIAKHQSDVRDAKKGSCCGHSKGEEKCSTKKKGHKEKKDGGCCSSTKKKKE